MSNKPQPLTKARLKRYNVFAVSWVSNGHNGTQAAIDAGYSPRCAAQQAVRLLKLQPVWDIIDPLERKLTEHYEMTADSVMKELGAIVHFDPRKCFNEDGSIKTIPELDDATAHALSDIIINKFGIIIPKGYDKNRAIENAMKHYKLLDGGVTINNGIVIISPELAACC